MLVSQDAVLNGHSYYEASVLRPKPLARLQGTVDADVCIVGAGFAGLSAAIELRLKGYKVIVLEAQQVGWGASGRNGGQIIVGFADDSSIKKYLPKSLAQEAWDISVKGVQLLRDRVDEFQIDCDFQEGFLHVATTPKKARALDEWIKSNIDEYHYPHYRFINAQQMDTMIRSPRYGAAVYDGFSGHCHPLKYALGLARIAQELGVVIYENTPAVNIHKSHKNTIKTPEGKVLSEYVVLAGNVYLNAYNRSFAPSLQRRILAVGTYITATEPIDESLVSHLIPSHAAVCDTNVELNYFRFTADRRMLFGGDVTFGGRLPSDFTERVRQRMCMTFPELSSAKIDYTWGGHVDMTMNLAPDFGRISDTVYYLQGFSGHGVALTGIAGKMVAQAIAGQAEQFDVFAKIRHRNFFGGERLRTPTLLLGLWYHRLLEFLGKK